MLAVDARTRLHSLSTPEAQASATRFFKTGVGQYGEGDQFIGVRVPDVRKVAREYRSLALSEIQLLLSSSIHEERLLALLILVTSLNKADESKQREVFEFYMENIQFVNNWDLVDTSAPTIVGGYLHDKSRRPLVRLAKSRSLWERRIAILATQYFIRREDFADTLEISRMLLSDKEDLIHKACGWMLREVGDRDEATLKKFLNEHAAQMPRTMLRYAIEKFPPDARQSYLARGRTTDF